MRQFVVAGIVVSLSILARADSVLIPLVDSSDPILITNSMLEFDDSGASVMTLELENKTAFPVTTREIWLDRARFYTRSEADGNGRKMWDCGVNSSAADDGSSTSIGPGQRAVVRLALVKSCEYHREHEHYFVHVSRVGARFSDPSWKREPQEFVRLLSAAQPHP